MLIRYILDEQGDPVPLETMDEAGNFNIENMRKVGDFLSSPARQIGETYFLGEAIRVSTVFLSIPHIFKDREGEALYETMVFADDAILQRLLELSEHDDRSIISSVLGGYDIQIRYSTKEEALKGHAQMCVFIETCVTNGLIEVTEPPGEDN
jgi:hypothetical protein